MLQLVSEHVGLSGQVVESFVSCFSYDCSLCNKQRMAGKNDAAIVAALQAMDQAVGQQPNAGGNDGVRMLETFMRNHPPTFKGRYDPDGAQTWLKEVERSF